MNRHTAKTNGRARTAPLSETAGPTAYSPDNSIQSRHSSPMATADFSAGLLAAIIASSDDAIVSKTLDGIVTSWNPAAERLFGYLADEMIGQSITRIIPKDRLPEEDFVLSRVRAGSKVDHFETIRQRKDGSFVEISLTVSPVRDGEGRIVGASKIARETSERKMAERTALRLAAIVESSEDAIVGKDLNGVVQSWNAGAERIFGFTAQEAIGKPITIIIPEERIDEESDVLARIRAGVKVEHFETVRRRKDGQLIEVSLSVSPIRATNGEVIGASKIARDITQQKRLQIAIEEASRAKDEFFATLSHELRTPLNTVLGYTRMLQNGSVPQSDLTRALEIIARNADTLTRLVNDLLDTSSIITGRLRLNPQACELSKIALDAIAGITPGTIAKEIQVTASVEPDVMVHGDPDRLRQVMWNLLSNAVKFTPRQGSLEVSLTRERHSVRLTVQDTGVGIAPESLPYVFRRFWQADPTNRRAPGLGLGLTLARDIVELHGGRLEASSAGLGHGARFDIILPLPGV
jgi:PAS domain S-box-containing protein